MRKFKNVFWLAVIVASAVVVGCEKDDDVKAGNSSFDGVIKATVSTGNTAVDAVKALIWYYDDYKEKEYVFAEAKYENGGFTIQLPATVPAQYLHAIFEEGPPQGVIMSDVDAKGVKFERIHAYKDGREVGSIELFSEIEDHFVFFMYVDRDVNITGSYSNHKYSLFLKKGWNKRYAKEASGIKEDTTTGPSGGLKGEMD